jgi:hypothetical protein
MQSRAATGDIEALVNRSLDNFTDTSSAGIDPIKCANYRAMSPEIELRNLVDFDLELRSVTPQAVSLISIDDGEASSNNGSRVHVSQEILNTPTMTLSPAESLEIINPKIIKLNDDDFYSYRKQLSEEDDESMIIDSCQDDAEHTKASLACSPRISVNLNRWLSLNG